MDTDRATEFSIAAQNNSKKVYAGMIHKVGAPQQVKFRRDIADIVEQISNSLSSTEKSRYMISGSHREGFRLLASDLDFMYWPDDYRVIWDFSESEFNNIHRRKLIHCDRSESPPGFTLLWLPLENASDIISAACVKTNGRLYISSSKYREIRHRSCTLMSTTHGPCSTGTIDGKEYDFAYCFVSDVWPPSASSWIDRCHSWPPPLVVNDIVKNGCHFVAIGHKLGNHEDNEWRISFSRAEHKIVYVMNHTQFLTYGLMKFFLKKIINDELKNEDKLLCSYHMKTVIFWAIQQNTQHQWSQCTMMDGFWICFKLLIKWVYEGICPHFFIPENNLFLGKIHGKTQTNIFNALCELYEKDIPSMAESLAIASGIKVILKRTQDVSSSDEFVMNPAEFDKSLFLEIENNIPEMPLNLKDCIEYLCKVEQLIRKPLTQYQVLILQKLTAFIMQTTAFIIHNMCPSKSGNKQIYVVDKISCNLLKIASKLCCFSDLLYTALYYYKTSRYMKALSLIRSTKAKLAQPYIIYNGCVNMDWYISNLRNLSLSARMCQAVAMNIKLINIVSYIIELIHEQVLSGEQGFFSIHIPPFVLLHMLEFLCCEHVDTIRAQRALDELQELVHNDQGRCISRDAKGISWRILGFCQQINGNHQAALSSWIQSVAHNRCNRMMTAFFQLDHQLRNLEL